MFGARSSRSRGREASPADADGEEAGPEHQQASQDGARCPGLSLKGRALKHLAAREHSRVELQRKLAPHAESAEAITQVLDEFEARGFLSAERFAQSVLHRKAARYGAARVQAELAQHRLPPEVTQAARQQLKDTEFSRAQTVWARRFGAAPTTPEERAKQSRFLAGRGFSGDAIRAVLKAVAESAIAAGGASAAPTLRPDADDDFDIASGACDLD